MTANICFFQQTTITFVVFLQVHNHYSLKMTYNTHTLSNGLRIIHTPSYGNIVYCGFSIAAGTRDEMENEQGMAHFVEHTIFKGTLKRKAWHILNRMENVGGDLNAYTNKEETVIYTAFLPEHFERAVELMSDIVFNSVFPQKELEKEKEVILDEISMYEDSPGELIFDDFEDMLFNGHPLGRNILGTPETLKSFTQQSTKDFTLRYYTPSNMVMFVRGNIDFKKITRMAEKYLGNVEDHKVERNNMAIPEYVPTVVTEKRDIHQTYVMIGTRGYDAFDDRRTTLYLINNILGGPGMNSRLNVEMREKRGLVYNVEASLTSYKDTGVFCINFASDYNDSSKCIAIVEKQMKKLRDIKMSSLALNAAKKQLIGQIGVASDNNENCALDMAKSFLHYGKFNSSEKLFKRIEAITPEMILEVANEKLAESQLSRLIYCPKD